MLMRLLIFCVLFCYLFVAVELAAIVTPFKQSKLKPRIIGGEEAKPGQFPYQVSLFRYGKQHCGGVILKSKYVGTAAHCTVLNDNPVPPEAFIVKGGDVNLNSTRIQQFRVKKIYIHKSFERRTFKNDIAILELDDEIKLQPGIIEPIELIDETVPEHYECIVSGWGIRKQNTIEMPVKLFYAVVQVINLQYCKAAYKYFNEVDSKMICAGYDDGSKDACEGDSGGPLVCSGKLAGVVSWGIGCGLPRYPGVYTNVVPYRRWIYSLINKG